MAVKSNFESLIVDVKVENLDRAIAFYREILELELLHKARDWASLRVAGAEIHLYLKGGASDGIEFRVGNIKKEVEALKAKGAVFEDDIAEFDWGKIAFFRDSEGNRLALVQD